MSDDFTPDQKRYLEGFMSGMQSARTARGLGPLGGAPGAARPAPAGPDREHQEAQARTVAAGGKLVDQEKWKAAEHPFDAYARFKDQAGAGLYPKPEDNFRWRYHGLFYVAPAQNSYMCRLRIPNGILKAWQFAGVADLAEALCGPYAHVTTRANLQVREIPAENAAALLEGLADLGLTAKGSGADNIRNVTGSATAGIDPLELLDTRPHARAWHHHILNDRSLYGLPRKFNVAFDGAGSIATLEDTNDIGFQAIDVMEGAVFEGQPIAPGIWYRLALGGITGHKDLARDTGVIVAPSDAIAVSDAIIRVFIAHGNRTDRAKSRLKYVLDAWGFEHFLEAVEEKLGRRLLRLDTAFVKPRPVYDRLAHIGVHKQAQPGLNWIGVALPVGKLTVAADARPRRDLATLRRWRYPPDRLAEPAHVRRARCRCRGCPGQSPGHRPLGGDLDPAGRPDRLHRRHGLQIRRRLYQGGCAGDCRPLRAAHHAGHARQHPPDRLPQLLRPALYRRSRPDRHQGPGRRGW